MSKNVGNLIAGAIDRVVRTIVVPIANAIPFLASNGILLVAFAVPWLGVGVALVANPGALGDCWRTIQQLPLPVQGIAWLLGLPLMAGLWVWGTDWPLVVRLVLVAGLAGGNLLVLLPRREPAREARAVA